MRKILLTIAVIVLGIITAGCSKISRDILYDDEVTLYSDYEILATPVTYKISVRATGSESYWEIETIGVLGSSKYLFNYENKKDLRTDFKRLQESMKTIETEGAVRFNFLFTNNNPEATLTRRTTITDGVYVMICSLKDKTVAIPYQFIDNIVSGTK